MILAPRVRLTKPGAYGVRMTFFWEVESDILSSLLLKSEEFGELWQF